MDAHEVLVAARNLIAIEGWTQRSLGNSIDGRCARGGLMYPLQVCEIPRAEKLIVLREVEVLLGSMIPEREAVGYESHGDPPEADAEWLAAMKRIVRFNNTYWRTKEEVLALLDKAIAATAPEPYVHLEVPEEVAA